MTEYRQSPDDRPKILLVEDDPGVRRSLQLLLQGRGFNVRAYATGEALLAEPARETAACLVADYQMDHLDGLQLLERLRSEGWDRPAVLITAFPSADLIKRAKAQGYDEILDKPLRDAQLTETVSRLAGQGLHSQ